MSIYKNLEEVENKKAESHSFGKAISCTHSIGKL